MKLIFIFLLTICGHALAENSISLEKLGQSIMEALQLKCTKNIASGAVGKIEAIKLDFMNCTVEASRMNTSPSTEISFSHHYACKLAGEPSFQKCIKVIADGIAPCLDEKEAYLPQLIIDFNDPKRHPCDSKDDTTSDNYYMDQIIRNDNVSCFNIAEYIKNGACISDLLIIKNIDKKILNLEKEAVYHDILSAKKCVTELMNRSCKKDYSRYMDITLRPLLEELKLLNSSPESIGNPIIILLALVFSVFFLFKH